MLGEGQNSLIRFEARMSDRSMLGGCAIESGLEGFSCSKIEN